MLNLFNHLSAAALARRCGEIIYLIDTLFQLLVDLRLLFGVICYPAAVDVDNEFCCPQPAGLSRIQGRAAGALDAVTARHLANDKSVFDIRLPPAIHTEAAVVMLGTDRNLQRLFVQINAVFLVDINGQRIHMAEPLNRCGL